MKLANIENIMEFVWIAGAALIILLAIGIDRYFKRTSEIVRLQAQLDVYSNTYKWRSGSSVYWRNGQPYRLFTLDAGNHWYHVEGGMVVAPADPELLKTIKAFEDLSTATKIRGRPLDLSNTEDQKLLRNIGFEVQMAPPSASAGLTK